MNNTLANLTKFSAIDEKSYDKMRDYYFHYMSVKGDKKLGEYDSNVSLADKEEKMHDVLMSEIARVSGQTCPAGMSAEQFAQNPMVKWAAFAIVDMMVDAILPETIIDSIGVYTDIRPVGFGETASFTVKPRSLFTVSQSSNAQRTAFINKQFSTTKTLNAINHEITVEVSLYSVLAGKENLAEFVRKAVISMETQMTLDAYNVLKAGFAASTVPSALKVSGYTQGALLTLCQTVTAYNQGAKAMIVGTAKALSNILPSATAGYRVNTPSDAMTIQLIRNFFDYDILVLPQVATGDYTTYGLALDDTKIYVISPSSDKLIKGNTFEKMLRPAC